MTMRLPADELRYQQYRENDQLTSILEIEKLREWQFWSLVENAFPHSKIATVGHMIVLKREAQYTELTSAEWSEFLSIILELDNEYDIALLNFASMRSVTNIVHIHVAKLRSEYK